MYRLGRNSEEGEEEEVEGGATLLGVQGYVSSSQPGCHVAHHQAPWILDSYPFDPEEYGLEEGSTDVPDIIIDPDSRMLSVINADDSVDKSFFITTSHRALDASHKPLASGVARGVDRQEKEVVTFVLVAAPQQVLDVCYLELGDAQANGEEPVDLYSDIKAVHPHPEPDTWVPSRAYPFPLGGDTPRLCSQGMGGRFTHFYPGTQHAVDFECPVGTPVLALAAGVVRETRQSATAGGIDVRGLFEWNSVTVLQDDGLLAEYVHILSGSATVCPGDRVEAGQPLCRSGDVGFCPTPHLHLQLQCGEADSAPTVRFALLDCDGKPYFPEAGGWYGPLGESEPPQDPGSGSLTHTQEGLSCRHGGVTH
ncbi:unnamed protein product [Discosporangium mesarthrocarpum]